MTLENLLSQMGIGTKHLTDRYSEYGAPVHDQHVYYAYDPPSSHGHAASSKHSHGGGHKGNAAMSALTLLAFLFFLHILQQCVKDHINDMNNAPIVVMGGREGDENISKSVASHKIDRTGVQELDAKRIGEKGKSKAEKVDLNKPGQEQSHKGKLAQIKIAEHVPSRDTQTYKYVFNNYQNHSSAFPEFVSALDDDY